MRHTHRCRRIAARAAQQARHAAQHSGHRIVDARGDIAIVHQKCIDHTRETDASVIIRGALRFVGDIAACQHERDVECTHDQMMQRRRRQHKA